MTTDGNPRRQRHLGPSVPLCLNCLQPYDPLHHYCAKCGCAVGQLTPNIPFVNIPYQMEFWQRLWRRVWSPQSRGAGVRVLGTILILLMMPLMLIGVPFVMWNRRRPQPRGFDGLTEVEQKLASASEQTPLPNDSPDDARPKYSDRPPCKPR